MNDFLARIKFDTSLYELKKKLSGGRIDIGILSTDEKKELIKEYQRSISLKEEELHKIFKEISQIRKLH